MASDAAGAPEPDWPALTARVIDKGETPGAIAAEIGASVELVASMVVEERARRRRDAPRQVDVDWRALVARVVDGGERVGGVARAAGVHLNALSIRVTRARAGWVFGADGRQTKMPPPSLNAFRAVGKRCIDAIGVETPGEPEASSTPQGEDAPVTGEGPAAAGAEVVGEDGADPSLSPADAAPEEVEGPSGPEAAAGESPAPSLVPPPRNRHEGLMAQDDLPSDEAGPEVALPRCDGDEGAGARPQQSSQAKPVPEPAGEEPLPDAPTDPDPAPLREPEPIDAAPVAMRPLIDVRRRDTDPDWEAILARVDAGEWPNMVALDEGVDPNALRDRLRARLTAKAAAQAAAVTPEPRDSFWTAQRDYELVRGIIRDGVGKTCAAMGVSDGVALARWNELLPVKGIAEQAALVNRLRVAVEALA